MASSVEKQSHPAIDHVDDNERKEEEERFGYAMQLVCSSVMSMSLQSAIELSVFDIIAGAGPNAKLSSSEIAAQIGTKNPEAPLMLDRILRLLATYTVLNCSVSSENGTNLQRLYSLSPVSKYFLTDEDGGSLGPIMALIQDKIFLESWFQLKDAVVEGGIPFNRAHGTHAFEYAGLDTRFNQVLNKGMLDYTTLSAKKMLDLYKGFEHLTKLVDVGGGLGVTIDLITSRYPHIKGVNFDLPHVIKNAPSYPGVEHVGGDMFESVPSGDAVFMKWILHDWSDEHCLKLLKNCYNAVPENGKVIIVEGLLPAMPETMTAVKNVCLSDVLMMTQNPGGKERSQEEFTVLATAAGFKGIRYECFVCSNWVMELFK